jgi:hypothetical protein
MVIAGHVHNGVVVLDGNVALPEGAVVTVSFSAPATTDRDNGTRRVEVPLVRTGQPGSVNLTGRQIAEILDEEDAAPRR